MTDVGAGTSGQDAADAADEARAPYTSVIFVHGIGSQRRYEDASRLIDRLDEFAVNEAGRGNRVGRLRGIRARVEPSRSRVDKQNIVGHIAAAFEKDKEYRHVRFYEAYWAPVLAEQRSPWRVVKWLGKQVARPILTLMSPWRERQRLRRATLVEMAEEQRLPPGITHEDTTELIRQYYNFEGLAAQRDHPRGTFKEFGAFVAKELKDEPEQAARCGTLARAWHGAYVAEEWRTFFLLLTLAVTIGGFAVALTLGILGVLQFLLGGVLADVLRPFPLPFSADLGTALTIFIGLAGLLVGRFVVNFIGDVEVWSTYEETDERHVARNKVLNEAIDLFSHVLADPACERVVVIAHSLGTSIAHDALLALTRRNRAHDPHRPMNALAPLDKIEHFITYGSPIDKIERFFESYSSASHRYKRVIETLRGDLGTEPFSRNRKPHIHWINFWDEGDPISGTLHSPASGTRFQQRIDNSHVASFGFPWPGKSHAGYMTNRTVIATMFEVIFGRARSFQTLPTVEGAPRDYQSTFVGRGTEHGMRRLLIVGVIALPWLGLGAWIASLFGAAVVMWSLLGVAVVVLVPLVIAGLAGRRQRNPI